MNSTMSFLIWTRASLAMVVSMPQSWGGTLRKCDWGIRTGLALACAQKFLFTSTHEIDESWCSSDSTAVNHSLIGIKAFQLPHHLATTQCQRLTHWHYQLTCCLPKKITIVTECSQAANDNFQHLALHNRANSFIIRMAAVRPSS